VNGCCFLLLVTRDSVYLDHDWPDRVKDDLETSEKEFAQE
jgi:hypothetical protein